MEEQKVNECRLVDDNGSLIKKICGYFRNNFYNMTHGGIPLEKKVEKKIAASLIAVENKITNQVIIKDDLLINELKENTFLKKLIWDDCILIKKYGHLLYSQNIRTISTQYKKILINKFGAEILVEEKVSKTNVISLLKAILLAGDFTEIKTLIKAYCDKFNLTLKK